MILKKAIITNFRGINGSVTINFDMFNCIVGQNDAGKSTILKAIDAVLNETTLNKNDYNVNSEDNQISIELFLNCQRREYLLGEEILTTFEGEELVDEQNLLVWKKVWNMSDVNISKSKTFIRRKKYAGNNDFVLKSESQLIVQCNTNHIETAKGNGEVFNNVEKRQKLREYSLTENIPFSFEDEEIPTTGTSKAKTIGDSIRRNLPLFQYFKADTSLSDTDNTIQKYFKEMAFELIRESGH